MYQDRVRTTIYSFHHPNKANGNNVPSRRTQSITFTQQKQKTEVLWRHRLGCLRSLRRLTLRTSWTNTAKKNLRVSHSLRESTNVLTRDKA